MTKRWNGSTQRFEQVPAADAFVEEVIAVCRKHGLSLGHEDGHGAFLIQDIEGSEHNFAWLREAHFEATAPAERRCRIGATAGGEMKQQRLDPTAVFVNELVDVPETVWRPRALAHDPVQMTVAEAVRACFAPPASAEDAVINARRTLESAIARMREVLS